MVDYTRKSPPWADDPDPNSLVTASDAERWETALDQLAAYSREHPTAGTMVWEGTYDPAVTYPTGSVVAYQGDAWVAEQEAATPPSTGANYTQAFVGGLPVGDSRWTLPSPNVLTLHTTDLTTNLTKPSGFTYTDALQIKTTAGQTTTAKLVIEFFQAGKVGFWHAASSEGGAYDYGYFHADGVQVGSNIGGENTTWTYVEAAMGVGVHTFEWIYKKDGSADRGRDSYFVTGIITEGTIAPALWSNLSGPPGSTVADLGDLTDVDVTTTAPSDGQALVYVAADSLWKPGSGASGGEAGTLVWRGDWAAGTTYNPGDVVRTSAGVFTALTQNTGLTPSHAADPWTDTFNRADSGSLGGGWDVVDIGWVVKANKAYINANTGPRVIKFLTADGVMKITALTKTTSLQVLRILFGWVDVNNHYYFYSNNNYSYVVKVTGGVSTTLFTSASGQYPANTADYTITKTGGSIQVVAGAYSFSVTDPDPLTGTGWGVEHVRYSSSYQTTMFDQFEFTPHSPSQAAWQVLDRYRENLASLSNVAANPANHSDVLTYDTNISKWVAAKVSTPPDGVNVASGVALTVLDAAARASASGSRIITGYDSVVRQDTGWTTDLPAGTITVPANGWYVCEGHARISAATSGNHHLAVSDAAMNTFIRSEQISATNTTEVSVSGLAYFAAGTILALTYFSSSSTQLVGSTNGQNIYFRVLQVSAGVGPHAANHASGGSDPVTPAAIGAAPASHQHDAADVASGLLDAARLGTGTPDGTKFLRDDQTWATGGNTYTPNRLLRSNYWYGAAYYTPGTAAHILGLLSAIPFFVPHSFRADRIACEVTTAVAGASVRMSIHATNPATDGPGNLLLGTAALDAGTTGVKEVVIDQTLLPGLYWLGAVTQAASGGGPTLRSLGSGTQPPVPHQSFSGSSATLGMNGWYITGITAAIPDWPSSGGTPFANAYKVMVRAAV